MKEALLALVCGDAGVTAHVPAEAIAWDVRLAAKAIAFHFIGGRPDYHLQGASGLRGAAVQIDCWAPDRPSADDAAAAVEALLSAYVGGRFKGVFIEQRREDKFEPGDGANGSAEPSTLFRTSLDVRVWTHPA